MNLLENYLVEIHSVKPCNEKWTNEDWAKDEKWLTVDATFDCWGNKSRCTREYTKSEWETIVKKGYYMG